MEITTLRTRVAVGAFATVMIIGSGVAAAVITSSDTTTPGSAVDTTASSSPDVTVDPTTPTTPDETTVTTPSGADESETGAPADEARSWDAAECGDGEPMTHGQYVSSQPKGGESRSAAAQSDCGKPLASIGEDGDDGDDGDEGGDEADPPTPADAGAGNGNGNAYGRSK